MLLSDMATEHNSHSEGVPSMIIVCPLGVRGYSNKHSQYKTYTVYMVLDKIAISVNSFCVFYAQT